MVAPLSVNFIHDKTKTNDTISNIEKALKKLQDTIGQQISKSKHFDLREPNSMADIQFHIDIPIYSSVPWGHTNVLVLNSEYPEDYRTYSHAFDAILIQNKETYDSVESKDNIYLVDTNSSEFMTSFLPILKILQMHVLERRPKSGNFCCPPVLVPEDCPPISIITPTYNRNKLIQIAFHNLLATDYPHNKIEWVVIEDNENKSKMATEDIMSFQIQVPDIKLKYIPIEGRMTIGEKRNIAIENASNDIIVFMDDDDHYPITSFRRRVAWLTKGVKKGKVGADIVCCTTLALYDLKRGISAVNVPPYNIPFSQRISEATLAFRKSVWEARKFPNISISEGEEWIKGREESVIEIPAQQIIVAFSHGDNKSARRIPPSETPPACFWGFPKEYLIFIHKLVGVEVEEDKKTPKKK